MPIRIRPYGPSDFELLHGLFSAYLNEERRRVPGLSVPEDFPETSLPKRVRDAEERNGWVRVAEVDGERAGVVAALPKERPDPWEVSRTKAALVMELHVSPAQRRRRVARALLRRMEDELARAGFDWVTLGVFATNTAARGLTVKSGFREACLFMGTPLGPRR
jgi:ribosomal protein S18 acetylase RimI-like enzyme